MEHMNTFGGLRAGPLDPILVSFQDFAADPRPHKVNLGVGMYQDAQGRLPIMRAVAAASAAVSARGEPYGYLMAEGLPAFGQAAGRLVFGPDLTERFRGRLVTLQALGGTGALRMGAELLRLATPDAVVAVSRPSWSNHHTVFRAAGLRTAEYAYYDPATGGVDFPRMLAEIEALPAGSVVLLHACCHNPTGADLTPPQWVQLAGVLAARRLVPFLDLAYGGFGEGLEPDMAPVRLLAESGLDLLVATSFSKSFALYGERVGAISVLTASAGQGALVTEALKGVVRNLHSTPPRRGSTLVAEVLGSEELSAVWRTELEEMRLRVIGVRRALHGRLADGPGDFSYLLRQKGLFSYSGLSPQQIERLKRDFAIHAVSDSRLCVAAVNDTNVDRVADALRAVTLADAGAGITRAA